jgi:hypothetical protein
MWYNLKKYNNIIRNVTEHFKVVNIFVECEEYMKKFTDFITENFSSTFNNLYQLLVEES